MRLELAAVTMMLAAPAAHAVPVDAAGTVPAGADREVVAFLDQLRVGKGAQAVAGLLSSPLWAQKAGAREAMTGQIDAAVRAYGPVTGYERVSTDRLGTMVIREYYLVQHRDMVTRWEFEMVRSASGWHVANFGFTDQANTWF